MFFFDCDDFVLNSRVDRFRKPEALFGKVSWSDKSVQYYLHVIDHSKLALYYEKIHQMHSKGTKISYVKYFVDCSCSNL